MACRAAGWLDRAPRGRNETGVGWRRRDECGGELRPGVDAGLVLDTLVGLLAWRTFVTREATGEEVLERAVDLIVSGVGAARAG